MATVNVVCPRCGKEVKGTIPRDAKINKVNRKSHSVGSNYTQNKCPECGGTFYVGYRSA
jgi:endogenous inhibitor of DNA gyrase (YacG/DUF329 family)